MSATEHVDTFSSALESMLARLTEPRESALAAIAEQADKTADQSCSPVAGYALASPITSMYLALTAPSLEVALVSAVNLGGDTDTIGAMVGAIAGAMHGRSAIPERWLEPLVANHALDEWIDPILRRDVGWTPDPSLLELEKQWNRVFTRGRRGRTMN